MKKVLITLALAVTAVAAFAQGKISFANDSTRPFVLGDNPYPGDSPGPIPQSPLPSGRTLIGVLYAGTTSNSLTLQTSIPLTGTAWLTAGRMATKTVILTIPGGAPQYFGIALVDNGALLPGAIDGNLLTRNPDASTITSGIGLFSGTGYYGSSGLFTCFSGTSITYPFIYQPTPPVNSTWQPGPVYINAAPEPSSLALAGLSAGMLLLFRRRK